MTARLLRIALAMAACCCASPGVQPAGAQQATAGPGVSSAAGAWVAGIRPVTQQDVEEAIALARGGGQVNVDPLLDRLTMLRRKPEEASSYPGPRDEEEWWRFLRASPFVFSIESPFSRIVTRVGAWQGLPNPPSPPTVDSANEEMVVIRASTKHPLETADDVKEIVIRRGETTWRPVRSESHGRTTIREGDRQGSFRDGVFTFPFAAFEPSSDITVVIVGEKGTFEWTIAREELAAMR